MPRLLAVIAEEGATARPLTRQLGTTRTASRYHNIPTIRSRTPSGIWVMNKQPAQRKFLILGNETERVRTLKDSLDVVGMESLGTSRTLDIDTALHDLDRQVVAQTIATGSVATGRCDTGEVGTGLRQRTKRAVDEDRRVTVISCSSD